MEFDVDVLVIGAGAGGLAAAIAAADAGASVALVEKQDRAGGNSSLSTGSVPGAGTRFQREAGIDDSPERFAADLWRTAPQSDSPGMVARLTTASAPTVEWLADTVGARISLITDYKHVGHSVPRLHAPRSRRGQDLVDDLLAAAAARDVPLAVGNAVTSLITDADGAVTGAMIDSGDGPQPLAARKVILAVNGFAANKALLQRFCPEIAGPQYFGAQGSTGEAVTWGEAIGARLANMGAYQGYAAVSDPHGSLVSWTTVEKGAVMLNGSGCRFGNEGLGYSGFTPVVATQGGACFVILDQRIFEIAALESEFMELFMFGGVKRGETLADLAATLGLPAEAVEASLSTYNTAASGRMEDPFGRTDFALAPLTGPFYGCRAVPGVFHTQGGLDVDDDGRVMALAGGVVPNLFAVGGAAVGVSGRTGPQGYASGNGLLSAVVLGRLAGEAAAREALAQV